MGGRKAGCWGHPAFPVQYLKGGKKREIFYAAISDYGNSINDFRVFCVNDY